MPIALLTDFGPGSIYVGQIKGVLASLAPAATVIDLAHEVAPQAVDEGAFLLASAFRVFPPGTIFLAVVDPGVGSEREIAILEGDGRTFVAPDNGLLSLVREATAEARAFRVGRALYASVPATFHGRDIMAPVAARIACGEAPSALGEPLPIHRLRPYPAARPRWDGAHARCRGRIVHVDRFGDLVSDVAPPGGRAIRRVRVGGAEVERTGRTFTDVEPGTMFAYTGSFGTVEVAVRDGSAAAALGARRGADVEVEFEPTNARGPEE